MADGRQQLRRKHHDDATIAYCLFPGGTAVTQTPRHPVSVAAVVTNDNNRILVIQRRDNGAWQLPGGVLELTRHRTPESAARCVRRRVLRCSRSA